MACATRAVLLALGEVLAVTAVLGISAALVGIGLGEVVARVVDWLSRG